jgi:hypothetical protein
LNAHLRRAVQYRDDAKIFDVSVDNLVEMSISVAGAVGPGHLLHEYFVENVARHRVNKEAKQKFGLD